MKVKELNIEPEVKSQEEVAKKVVLKLYEIVEDRKNELIEAEKKLQEVLEKEVEEVKEKDSNQYSWED